MRAVVQRVTTASVSGEVSTNEHFIFRPQPMRVARCCAF